METTIVTFAFSLLWMLALAGLVDRITLSRVLLFLACKHRTWQLDKFRFYCSSIVLWSRLHGVASSGSTGYENQEIKIHINSLCIYSVW